MTRATFTAALALAVVETGATLTPNRDQRLRFSVSSVPLVLDPVGLVWYHRTGDVRGLLESWRVGVLMGLSPDDVSDCLDAADQPLDRCDQPAVRWRIALLQALESAGMTA
jgi:hypothetical protein